MICIDNKGQNGTKIFNILDNTTELWMTKYIIGVAPAEQICIRTLSNCDGVFDFT